MKRKFILLLLTASLVVMSLTGCEEKKNIRHSSSESKSSSESSSEKEDSGYLETESSSSISDSLKQDPKYKEEIEKFSRQFIEYPALCMLYPESTKQDSFSDQTKINLIGLTVGEHGYDDVKVEYDGKYGPYFKPADVEKMALLFFNETIDPARVNTIESYGYKSIYAEEVVERALMDNNGGIYVELGDWGLAGPHTENVEISFVEDGLIYTSNYIAIYEEDYEGTGEWLKAYDLGEYHLTIRYDLDNPYKYWITDFSYKRYELPTSGPFLHNPNTIDIDELCDKIARYYNEKYWPDGTYVVFSEEVVENGDNLEFIVRYQMSDEEQEERIANGDIPLANVYTATVYVNKKTKEAVNEFGDNITLK